MRIIRIKKNIITSIIFLILLTQCRISDQMNDFDLQGHRGCRGLYPENTIAAFEHALKLGVSTLEMDLAITADHQVVVSHEPFFNHEISTAPFDSLITRENQLEFNIYQMDYDEVIQYDVGMKVHPRFPDQIKIPAFKPLLSKVFDLAVGFADENNVELPYFNIEIKSHPRFDSLYHPPVDKFVDLVMGVVQSYKLSKKVTIQSFDVRALQYLNTAYPEMVSVYLIENENGFQENLDKLGFTPDIYSPDYKLITEEMAVFCQDHSIRLIPWTVNEKEDMKALVEIGVDGIITDYPDRFYELYPKQ